MKAKLKITEIICPHCKKDAIGNTTFEGDSEPYVEEEQKGVYRCSSCKKHFRIKVKFTVAVDTYE